MIEFVPTDRLDVEKDARPLPFSGMVARLVGPSLKVTLPVGVPPPEVTVAVNVTVCPDFEGFKDEVTTVALAACGLTV